MTEFHPGFFVRHTASGVDNAMVSAVDEDGDVWFVYPTDEGVEFSCESPDELDYLGRTGSMTFRDRDDWDVYQRLLETSVDHYSVAIAFAWAEGQCLIEVAP